MEPSSTLSQHKPDVRPGTEADQRLATVLMQVSVWLGIPLAIGAQVASKVPFGPKWAATLALIGVVLTGHWQIRKDNYRVAIDVLMWGATVVVSIQCVMLQSVRIPLASLCPLIVMLCGWLRGRRAANLMGGLLIGFLSLIALLEQFYWTSYQLREPLVYWAVDVFGIVLGSALVLNITEGIHLQFGRSQRAMNKIALQAADLRNSQKNFSAYFDLNPVPVSITRLEDGTYHAVNPAWERASGWSREEAIGRTPTELGLWFSTEERDAWVAPLKTESRAYNQLVRFRARNGAVRWFVANAEIVEYERQDCIIGTFADITKEREAREALQRLNAELEQRVQERTQSLSAANEALSHTIEQLRQAQDELVHAETLASLGALVAGISHELNTPIGNALTVVTTLSEQAREFDELVEAGKVTRSGLGRFIDNTGEAAELATRNLNRASDLIGSFKQVAIDQTSERRRKFQLDEVVSDVLETLWPSFRHRPITLVTRLVSGLNIDGYPGPLGQVVSNLVQNAMFHGFGGEAPEGGGKIRVECREAGPESVEIVVSDNGQGIDSEVLSRIFDPFFTTRLGQGGSGLGLSIVHRIVTSLLGGTISVASTPGEGAAFTVALPRMAPQQALTQALPPQ